MLEALLVCTACAHGVGYHAGSGCEVPRCSCPHDKYKLIEHAMSKERFPHPTMRAALKAYRDL